MGLEMEKAETKENPILITDQYSTDLNLKYNSVMYLPDHWTNE